MIQLLDVDLAQQAYEERLHKAEQNLSQRCAHADAAGQAPNQGANEWVNQLKRWLSGRPRRDVPVTRRPRAI